MPRHSRSYTVEAGSGYLYNDPYRFFIEKLESMRTIAREATNKAYSYREKPVKVGTAVLSVVDFTQIWGISSGYNNKSEHKEKNCGELKALNKSHRGGFSRAIGAVVVSSTDKDENEGINGFRTPTLLPCSVCQGDFRAHPVARPDTLVITAGLEHDVIQINTVDRLAEVIANGDSDRLVHDRTISNIDFDRLLPIYDATKRAQLYVPEQKRLTGPELVSYTILSHKEIHI